MSSQHSQDFILEMKRRFKRSFYWACVSIFEVPFSESWLSFKVHKPICDLISDYRNNRRVAIILPRDWLKSQLCSIYYPIWRAMQNSNFTCMLVQNTFTNATKKLSAIRTILRTNKMLQQMYPERMITTACKVAADAICLPRDTPLSNDTFEAAGVGTDVTGRHLDLIVEDDTVAPEFDRMTGDVYEPSAERVEKAIGFHQSLHFLLQDLEKSQRLVVGTRWRERDLFTWIEEKKLPYKFIRRAVREDSEGKPDPKAPPSYPERFGETVLSEIYATVGDYMYNALMMSTPLSGRDAIFKDTDLLLYEEAPRDLMIFTTVDPAGWESRSADPDYNAVVTTGISLTGQGIFVLDCWRERCTPGEVIEEIFSHVERYKPLRVGIEKVGYQKTLRWWVQETQNKRHIWFNVDDVGGSKLGKVPRIRGLQPLVANGQLHIRAHMTALRQEFIAFPRGAHDDLLDALSFQLEFWQHSEELREAELPTETERFTGAHILAELRGRHSRAGGFPYDLMSITKQNQDLIDLERERGPVLTESYVVGGGQNYACYYN